MPDLPEVRDGDRIRTTRTASLLLDDRPDRRLTGPDVVSWFGAMQGQDLASVVWSVGLRAGVSRTDVHRALESGALVRTWPLRGTLHLVTGQDAAWLVQHFAARGLARGAARRRDLGLSEGHEDRACAVLDEVLADRRVLTRSECVAELAAAGIPTDGQRAYHLLRHTCQRGVLCVGANRESEQTFARLVDVAPTGPELDRAEALARLATRYVRSHGPVSAHDFARWADLSVTDSRSGLAAAQGIVTQQIGGRELFSDEAHLDGASVHGPGADPLPARALPGFDEFVIGYRDRSAQLDPELERTIVPGGNGVFTNTLVTAGRVVGTWRRRELAGRVELLAAPARAIRARERAALEAALARYAEFLGKTPTIRWSPDLVPDRPG